MHHVSRRELMELHIGLFLAFASALLLFGSSGAGAQPQRAAPPNVVLIMTDDAGYADIGSYGAPDIRTPNIDSLARDGVRLMDFYANAMSCTPTRAGLIAGRISNGMGLSSRSRPRGCQARTEGFRRCRIPFRSC